MNYLWISTIMTTIFRGQADKLVLKCTFPEQASNSEWARFYYYQGRIKATQLDYSAAHTFLVQSSRKAPQNSANGFKQHVTKLSITVELLLGNIPERQVFLQKEVSFITPLRC